MHPNPPGTSVRASSDSLPSALPAAIAALAIGASTFSRPEYLRQRVILVTSSDTALGAPAERLYAELGGDVISIPANRTVSALKHVFARWPQLIVSGRRTPPRRRHSATWSPRRGRLFLRNRPDTGITHILDTDPVQLGMRCASRCATGTHLPHRPHAAERSCCTMSLGEE